MCEMNYIKEGKGHFRDYVAFNLMSNLVAFTPLFALGVGCVANINFHDRILSLLNIISFPVPLCICNYREYYDRAVL